MLFRKKESKIKLFFFNQTSYFLVGLVLLALISYPLSKKIFQNYQLNNEVKNLNEEIKKMESHNQELKNLIGYLDSKSFTEEEARLSLNLKKSGEEVVVIKNNNEEAKDLPAVTAQTKYALTPGKKEPLPRRWWNYFFNRSVF